MFFIITVQNITEYCHKQVKCQVNLRRKNKCQVSMKKILKSSLNPVYILFICLFFVCIYSNDFIHLVKDEEYNVLVKLYKREFSAPVSDHTRLQKSTIVKF